MSLGVIDNRPNLVTKFRLLRDDPGRVDLGGRPPRPPTDPGLHITRTRFLIS